MKLRKLTVKKYRNHADSSITIGDASFVCVRGANASGKTSLLEAFGMNVTGTAVSLAADGKGFKSKVMQGERDAEIIAEIQGQHLLRNTMTLSLGAGGRTSDVECLDLPEDKDVINRFKNFLADKRTALQIATSTDYFAKVDDENAANLMAKLVLPEHHDFPQDKIEDVDEALGKGVINFDANPFEVIAKSYKLLFDERADANKKVKNFVIPDALPIPKGVDSESLQKELASIREQRSKLQGERDEAVAKAHDVELKRTTLQTRVEGLRAELGKGKLRLEALEKGILSAEDVQRFTDIAGKDDELDKLKQSHAAYLGGIRNVTEEISRLNGISDKGATCPTCDQDIDTAKIERLVADLKEESVKADVKLQELDKKIEAIGDVQGAKESLRKHEAASKEHAELKASLIKTVETGKATKAELDAIGEAVNATLPFNDPLAALQAKEDKINGELRPVMAAEERAVDVKAKTEQKAKLVAKAAKLDALVKYFDSDGVKAELIAAHIGSFESKVFEVLDAFGYKASLKIEPSSFDVTTKRGYKGPVKELSRAEKQLFYPAFQCAVSIAAGINLVVIDDMDVYLQETGLRKAMFKKLYELVKDGILEQVIIIEASVDNKLPSPRAPNSKYFFVTDGTVEELR